MLDWIKNIGKEYPEFWKEYVSKFDKKSQRFIVFSLETTGLNPAKDVILSMGSFAIIDNSIAIGDNFEAILLQYKYLHDNKLSNEFIVESKLKKLSEPDAIKEFVDYIGNAILVGHHVNFDVEMINFALEKLDCGKLKNEALDIEVMYQKLHDISDKQFSLDELCDIHKIPVSERNSASESAYKIGLLFLKLKTRLGL
jgi:DNA polymerase III subunit epsilon